jgi:hypothetical protein
MTPEQLAQLKNDEVLRKVRYGNADARHKRGIFGRSTMQRTVDGVQRPADT